MTAVDALQSAILWYLTLTALVILVLPVTFHVCRGLPDRGLAIYRPFGLVLVALPVWWFGNLLPVPFTRATFILTALALGVAVWALEFSRWQVVPFARARWRKVLAFEAVTAVLFFGYILVRGFNPDTRGTEKPMELALLNAAILSDGLPVPDPWFAGEPINYYYFGYAVLGLLAKLTGLSGGVVFHLGLATTFSLAAVAAAGLASNLVESLATRPRGASLTAALLSGFLVMFSGNLFAASEYLRAPSETVQADWWGGIGWESSRVVEDSGFPDGGTREVITEFPAFSWILGDLHPHVLAYPWLIMSLALVLSLCLAIRSEHGRRIGLAPAAGVGVALAVLYSSNTWDVPMVGLLAALALISALPQTGVRGSLGLAGIVGSSALLVVLPFALSYTPAAGDPTTESGVISRIPLVGQALATIGYVDWDRTSASDLFLVHGGFLLLAVIVIAGLWARAEERDRALTIATLGGMALLVIAGIVAQVPALILIGIPMLALLPLMGPCSSNTGRQAALALVIVAFAAILVTEFFYIRDPFGDRMNTVFKIYFQVWTMLSIALAALIPDALHRIRSEFHHVGMAAAIAVIALVLLAASIYTPISAYHWFNEFDRWRGIDGLSYLEDVQPAEAAAIDWLRDNAGSSSVIVEAPGCAYGSDHGIPHNRYSIATGIPTIIGWDGHQLQWRRQQPEHVAELALRVEHVREIYESPSPAEAEEFTERYGVTHIIVGVHERQGYARCDHGPPYSSEGLAALDQLGWNEAYEREGVTIYVRSNRRQAN